MTTSGREDEVMIEGTTRQVLDRVGDMWSALVVLSLSGGTLRFSELRRHIGGISQQMLTSTLRTLERDGLVRRVVHPTRPPKVEYSLTELGGTLVGHIVAFKQWADDHVPQILAAREAYDAAESRARGGPPPS